MKTEMLAMILAGGRGSRLLGLTTKSAKPAVYYGGKYRIIDFPLSNCANSNISIVGILTQYESIILNSYVSKGSIWGLDGIGKGSVVLPPRETTKGFGIYAGTADAIYQNIDFMDQYDPEYVLILSGDHIYKMDYDEMLKFHKEKGADLTIAGLTVTMEEAKRFGIMNTDADGKIVEFEEKPQKPKNNQASMGIYIFTYSKLRDALIKDHENKDSHNDFGKDVIPYFLNQGMALYAYPFKGYWKDVGTVDSLWEANMDLLDENNELNLFDSGWPIYTEDLLNAPHYISDKGSVERSLISQGTYIGGKVKNSVIFGEVRILENAEVTDSVIMPNAVVSEGTIVRKCIVADDVVLKAGKVYGDGENVELICKGDE
ncbi:MAG: glucose-1-phosphate adenylyltransferase [Erysipelotrichaceae bacterium]|nr:glucose-1-phosphate adenylyltransferase [Erysipelotrichaceae bacterium]